MRWSFVQASMLPQLSSNHDRIEFEFVPPCRFVAPAMKDPVVGPAKGNRELVADPAAQRSRLGKSQVVGVRRPAAAQEARLGGNELEMRTIAVAAWFAQRESAFIDMPSNRIIHSILGPRAYCGGYDAVRGGARHRSDRPPATSLSEGIRRHRSGSIFLGQLGRRGPGRE